MTHLTADDLRRLRDALLEEYTSLQSAQQLRTDVGRGGAGGEIEDGDVAERMIEQESALRLASLDAQRLADIERAFAKLDTGTYGLSEDSGDEIPLARLEAVPWARRTAEEEERRERT